MDFNSRDFYYDEGVYSFFDFLEGGVYADQAEDRARGNSQAWSLLDALQMWLYYGDGLDTCPTYESFLVATIVIIDNWLANDRIEVASAPLWPFGDERTPISLFREGTRVVGMSDVPSHPVLHRAVYEQIKSAREAEDRLHYRHLLRELEAGLRALAPEK